MLYLTRKRLLSLTTLSDFHHLRLANNILKDYSFLWNILSNYLEFVYHLSTTTSLIGLP